MNEENKNLITKNINYLADNTTNLDKFTSLLVQKDVFQTNEMEELMETNNSRYARCKQLYLLVSKKGGNAFTKLCEALKESNNEAPLKCLQSDGKKQPEKQELPDSGAANDFSVSERGALEIRNILQNHPTLEEDWKTTIPVALNLSGRSKGEIEKEKSGFGNIVFKTLRLWIKEKGTGAKFNIFLKAMTEQTNNAEACEELIQKLEKIRSVCG